MHALHHIINALIRIHYEELFGVFFYVALKIISLIWRRSEIRCRRKSNITDIRLIYAMNANLLVMVGVGPRVIL